MAHYTDGITPWDAMMRALELASRGPMGDSNPRVGAVLVDAAGRVVGEGWHEGAGTDHAEVMALKMAGGAARGATAYVTLEPCRHTGRTGPCTQAMIDAGIARLVYACPDPNPEAAGGAAELAAAGVEVSQESDRHLLSVACEVNARWRAAMGRGRPWVTWKFAATLDGYCAAEDGTSQWITSPESRDDVHQQRSHYGAVVIGRGTLLTDDPSLTARHLDGTLRDHQPLRVVLGRDIPPGARILTAEPGVAPPLLITERDPHAVLDQLMAAGVRKVWLEGGPRVAGAWLEAGVIDEVVAYLAPALLGAGVGIAGDFGARSMAQIRRLDNVTIDPIGGDVRIRGLMPTPEAQLPHCVPPEEA